MCIFGWSWTLLNPADGGVYGFAVPGSGPVFLEKLHCGEDYGSLFDCQSFSTDKPSTCHHTSDVGILCKGH